MKHGTARVYCRGRGLGMLAPDMVDLSVSARAAFVAIWLLGQGALVLTAGRRADAAFGFRMFAESTTLTITLSREVQAPTGEGTIVIPVEDGSWIARDRTGLPHRFAWSDRVADPVVGTLGVTMHAAYSGAAQLERLQAALDDVATHVPEDAETHALVADVVLRRNGREPQSVRLTSAPRALPSGR